MPKSPEKFEEIRVEKKQIIMNTALALFSNEGYHATSISKIASKANISKGLMYNYFESKDALLNAIIDSGFKELIKNFDLNKDEVLTNEEFVYFIDKLFNILLEKRSFWLLYFSLLLQPSISHVVQQKTANIYIPLLKTLQDFLRRNGFKNPEIEALLFGTMLDGLAFNYLMNPELFPIDLIKKQLIEKYLKTDNYETLP